MKILKTAIIAGMISLLTSFSSFAEKVKIGDPGWTGATAIANLLAAHLYTSKSQKIFSLIIPL